jgi:hypothetical protein
MSASAPPMPSMPLSMTWAAFCMHAFTSAVSVALSA